MKRIAYTGTATKQRRKLPADVRDRLAAKLAAYAETGVGDVKTLVGRPGARLRVGDRRIIFVESDEDILVVAVGHRRDIYTWGRDLTHVQFITTPDGQELAVLPRAEYERLAAAAGEEAAENAATARLVDRALSAIDRGEEVVLPAEVSDRLAAGDNPIRVLREWRGAGPHGMSQLQLAVMVGTTQSYVSDLERGKKRGNPELLKKIARALGVPLDLLVADPD